MSVINTLDREPTVAEDIASVDHFLTQYKSLTSICDQVLRDQKAAGHDVDDSCGGWTLEEVLDYVVNYGDMFFPQRKAEIDSILDFFGAW